MQANPMDAQVREHLEGCRGCSLYLEFSMRVEGKGPEMTAGHPSMPEGLEARLNESVLSKIKEEDLGRFRAKKYKPFSPMYRFVLAAAALVIMMIPILGERDAGFVPQEEPGTQLARVRLELEAPHAETVVVVGDWNNWDVAANRLAKSDNGGSWTIEMELERGKDYRYQFVIDGETWIPDPQAYMQVDDGFGGKNSLLEM